jgi:serine protease Do
MALLPVTIGRKEIAFFLFLLALLAWLPFDGAKAAKSVFSEASLPVFSQIAEKNLPSVVNVAGQSFYDSPLYVQMPSDSSSRPVWEGQPQTISLGSGFIIDKEGYVLTNNHVVEENDTVQVILHSGETLKAKVVGRDKRTDIALLKTEPFDVAMPPVAFGDSDTAKVGEWILAAGNPFGLGNSVTAGIISARSRDLNAGPYDDFLQIDATINQGNSGGPLFNMNGEVIGMNTAVYSPFGDNTGISFAIPSNLIKKIVNGLRKDGYIKRGWLGVRFRKLSLETALLLGLDGKQGVLVSFVEHNSPAYKAGIRPKDVILSFNLYPIVDTRQLSVLAAETQIGRPVPVDIFREGKTETLLVTLALMPENTASSFNMPFLEKEKLTFFKNFNFSVTDLTAELQEHFAINPKVRGVLIADVFPASQASAQGVRAGDLIVQADGKDTRTVFDFEEVLRQVQEKQQKKVILLLDGVGGLRYITLNMD